MNTLNDAFQAYIRLKKVSSKGSAVDVSRWEHQVLPFFGDVPLSQIKSYTILEFRAHLEKEDLSPQTVLHYLSLLRRILRKAVAWELYPGPVPFFEMPKFDNTRLRFLSQKEVGAPRTEPEPRSSRDFTYVRLTLQAFYT